MARRRRGQPRPLQPTLPLAALPAAQLHLRHVSGPAGARRGRARVVRVAVARRPRGRRPVPLLATRALVCAHPAWVRRVGLGARPRALYSGRTVRPRRLLALWVQPILRHHAAWRVRLQRRAQRCDSPCQLFGAEICSRARSSSCRPSRPARAAHTWRATRWSWTACTRAALTAASTACGVPVVEHLRCHPGRAVQGLVHSRGDALDEVAVWKAGAKADSTTPNTDTDAG
eukprot:scaffold35296_cov69-Phaeocystis_antarctica.AAC.1